MGNTKNMIKGVFNWLEEHLRKLATKKTRYFLFILLILSQIFFSCGKNTQQNIPSISSLQWNQSYFVRPPARYYTAVAYDSQSERLILFGGVIPLFEPFIEGGAPTIWGNDTWVYHYTTNTWQKMSPSSSPPSRQNAIMAYNSKTDRIILFGGANESGTLNDTWAYDYESNTWTNLNPVGGIPPYEAPAGIYDEENDRLLVFNNDTWSYDYSTNIWTNVNSPTKPPVSGGVMVYDSESKKLLYFFTLSTAEGWKIWNYEFTTNSWIELSATLSPPPFLKTASFSLAYDSYQDKVVLFGGANENGIYMNETWIYDYNTNTWQKKSPPDVPPIMARLNLAYDSNVKRVILCGGVGVGIRLSDNWIYNLEGNLWEKVTPADKPAERYAHAMAYDSESNRIILFGGYSPNVSGLRLDDTWAYNPQTGQWSEMNPSLHPDARCYHAIAYDSESDRVILAGGPGPSQQYKDVWAYDFNHNSWEKKSDFPGDYLSRHCLAYDEESDRVVLFGDQGTWLYDYNSDTWSNPNPSPNPSLRVGAKLVYDRESDRLILFGGFNSNQRLDDTWAYNVNTNTWTQMSPTTNPGARYGFVMAYEPVLDKVILFGGSNASNEAKSDTWQYDYNTNQWNEIDLSSSPSPRIWSEMVYPLVLFSGLSTSEGLVDDLWVLNSP